MQVRQSLKLDAKRFKRDNHMIKELLDQMTNIFTSGALYPDKTEVRKIHANLKALDFLSEQYNLKLKMYAFYQAAAAKIKKEGGVDGSQQQLGNDSNQE